MIYPTFKDIYVPTKVREVIFNAVLILTLVYGAETWLLSTSDENILMSAKMKPIRPIRRRTRRNITSNKEHLRNH